LAYAPEPRTEAVRPYRRGGLGIRAMPQQGGLDRLDRTKHMRIRYV